MHTWFHVHLDQKILDGLYFRANVLIANLLCSRGTGRSYNMVGTNLSKSQNYENSSLLNKILKVKKKILSKLGGDKSPGFLCSCAAPLYSSQVVGPALDVYPMAIYGAKQAIIRPIVEQGPQQ